MSQRLLRLHEAMVLRHPALVLMVVFIAAVVLAFGLPNFKLDASADSLTLEHDTDLDYFREVNQHYGSGDFLVVTFTPRNMDLFSDAALAALKSLTEDLSRVDGVVGVNSIITVPLLYSPKVAVAELNDEPRTLLSAGTDRQLAKREFLESPIYRDLILGPNGQTTAVLATIQLDQRYTELVRERDALRLKRDTTGLTPEEQQELDRVSQEFLDYRTARAAAEHRRVQEVRSVLHKYRENAEIFLGGPSMVTADMIDFIKSDLKIFGIGIILFIIVTLAVIFRQVRWVVLPLLVCVLSVTMVLGWLSWIDWRLTVISSNFVALLLISTLALTIHLIVRYRELLRDRPDDELINLVRETVSSMARPCLYTVLTTIVAFLSLVVSDIRPVIDFGWMMTIGLALALVLAFLVIPAGMMLTGKGANNDGDDNSASLTQHFSRFTERHGNVLLVLALTIALVSAYGVTLLKVDNRFIDYFRADTEIHQGLAVIDANLGGTTPLDIIIQAPSFDPPALDVAANAGDPYGGGDAFDDSFGDSQATEESAYSDGGDAFEDDAFGDAFGDDDAEDAPQNSYWFTTAGLDDLEKLHAFLESLPEIGKVNSLVTAFHVANDLTGHRLNDFELAVMRQNMTPAINNFLIAPYINDARNETRVTMRTVETQGDLRRAELLAEIENFLVEDLQLAPDQYRLTGLMVLYNNMLQSLFYSQIVTLGAVFFGIMLMFLVLFRSLKISLIAILPNLLAASIVLGGMGIVGIPLDMMTITIAAITVGIGVDHAIHYLTRFTREFVVDKDYVAAMHRSHATIGRALFYTAITIIVGFSILALSNFIPSVYFGLLTGVAMLAALLGSLTLLPKLILIFKPFGAGRSDGV